MSSSDVLSFPDLSIALDAPVPDLVKEAKALVKKIKSDWPLDKMTHKIFTEGVTNVLVGIYAEGAKTDMVLVRLYGLKTELIVDRAAEIRNMQLLHNNGLGPALLATFGNGIAYPFVPGDIATVDNITDPAVNQPIIETFAKMHKIEVERKEACMWERMRNFLDNSPDDGMREDPAKAARFKECGIMSKPELAKEIDDMEAALKDCKSPVVFCHNDLLLGNIILGDDDKVTFIDYEYGEANYLAFDVGNHFTEFVGVGDKLDYEGRYPSEAFQKEWLGRYLKAYKNGAEATEEEIHEMYVEVNKFSLCANLKWGTWALVQAKNSTLDRKSVV